MQVEATDFVTDAEARLAAMSVEQQRAEWVAENFITYDTQIIACHQGEAYQPRRRSGEEGRALRQVIRSALRHPSQARSDQTGADHSRTERPGEDCGAGKN